MSDLRQMQQKYKIDASVENVWYYIFSKGRFTQTVEEAAKAQGICLISVQEVVSGKV